MFQVSCYTSLHLSLSHPSPIMTPPPTTIGHIIEVNEQQVTVRLYDDTVVRCSKQFVHLLPSPKYQEDLRYIVEREHSVVGKVVIARSDSDGLFYPGRVLKHLAFPQVYLIGWKNGSTQTQVWIGAQTFQMKCN